jgi:hypothetical protein
MSRLLRKLGRSLGAGESDAVLAALGYLALPAAALALVVSTAF